MSLSLPGPLSLTHCVLLICWLPENILYNDLKIAIAGKVNIYKHILHVHAGIQKCFQGGLGDNLVFRGWVKGIALFLRISM